jgi:hypothetical protein
MYDDVPIKANYNNERKIINNSTLNVNMSYDLTKNDTLIDSHARDID